VRERRRQQLREESGLRALSRMTFDAFEFREGEAIHTEDSYKYSLEHFARLLAGGAPPRFERALREAAGG